MAMPTGVGQGDTAPAVIDLAGGAAVLAGHAHALVAAFSGAALIDEQDALGVAAGVIDPADQLRPQRPVGPRRLAAEVLGHADLRDIAAVSVQGDRFGGLVIVGVEQQAARVGFRPSHTAVIVQERTKPAHELRKARQRLRQILLGHERPPCQRAKGSRSWAPDKLAKPGWRGKANCVALYY